MIAYQVAHVVQFSRFRPIRFGLLRVQTLDLIAHHLALIVAALQRLAKLRVGFALKLEIIAELCQLESVFGERALVSRRRLRGGVQIGAHASDVCFFELSLFSRLHNQTLGVLNHLARLFRGVRRVGDVLGSSGGELRLARREFARGFRLSLRVRGAHAIDRAIEKISLFTKSLFHLFRRAFTRNRFTASSRVFQFGVIRRVSPLGVLRRHRHQLRLVRLTLQSQLSSVLSAFIPFSPRPLFPSRGLSFRFCFSLAQRFLHVQQILDEHLQQFRHLPTSLRFRHVLVRDRVNIRSHHRLEHLFQPINVSLPS